MVDQTHHQMVQMVVLVAVVEILRVLVGLALLVKVMAAVMGEAHLLTAGAVAVVHQQQDQMVLLPQAAVAVMVRQTALAAAALLILVAVVVVRLVGQQVLLEQAVQPQEQTHLQHQLPQQQTPEAVVVVLDLVVLIPQAAQADQAL
jgi:hypothetical protein